jgi:hypothetical protein
MQAPIFMGPRCLTRPQAASYVGVSVDTFDAEVRCGVWPAGSPRGGRGGKLTWDRRLLDLVLDRQSGLMSSAVAVPAPIVDAEAAYLEALIDGQAKEQRAKRRAKDSR